MSTVLVVGCDPGPTPGAVFLTINDERITDIGFAQVSASLITTVITSVVRPWQRAGGAKVLIGVERFVVGPRSSRSSTPSAGRIARDMVGVIDLLGRELGAAVVQRSASQVKAWATDERLKLAGIEIPKGMTHTKDAARHALYAAVHADHLPDPMSRSYKKPNLTH